MITRSSFQCIYLCLLILVCHFGSYLAAWGTSTIPSNLVVTVAGSWSSSTDVLIVGTQLTTPVSFSSIYKSSNGGSTWSEAKKITSVQIFDISSRVFGSTTYSVAVAVNGDTYFSSDRYTTTTTNTISSSALYAVVIAPTGVCFAVGFASSHPVIYSSTLSTSFSSWTSLTSSISSFQSSARKLRGISTYDGQNILTVGEKLTIFQSFNNGSTWSTVDISSLCSANSDLYSVSYKYKNFAMIGGTVGCIVKYDGSTWSSVTSSNFVSSSAFFYHSIQIVSSNIIFVIEEVTNKILRSVDGGSNWYVEQTSTNHLYCVAAYDYGIAIVGNDNTAATGTVYVRSQDPSSQPSSQPSGQPSRRPTTQPSRQPINCPTALPSMQPSSQPSKQPFSHPSGEPSTQPSSRPSSQPTLVPILRPTAQPTNSPTCQPSRMPSSQPTQQPFMHPSGEPTMQPSSRPTSQPAAHPSTQPSRQPSSHPSSQPSRLPTIQPSGIPTRQPSGQPSRMPTSQPTVYPSVQPSNQPTSMPTDQPSARPSKQPSSQPSALPSRQPSVQPSMIPTKQPSSHPTHQPSEQPTSKPTSQPNMRPSMQPTGMPSAQPTIVPSSSRPSSQPTGFLLDGNWTSVPGIFDDSTYKFMDVKCIDTINCVMVGYYFDVINSLNIGFIALTQHGGASKYVWSLIKSYSGYKMMSVTYYETYKMFFACDHMGGLYVSYDIGETWTNFKNLTFGVVNVTGDAVHSNFSSVYPVSTSIAVTNAGTLWIAGPRILWYALIDPNVYGIYGTPWYSATYPIGINDLSEMDGGQVAIAGDDGLVGSCYWHHISFIVCDIGPQLTTSDLYSVGASDNDAQGQAELDVIFAIAVDGTVVRRNSQRHWSRLNNLNISTWIGTEYGKNVVVMSKAVVYIADSVGRIYQTKNMGEDWVNETAIANVNLPIYCMTFFSTSVGVAGNSRGGIYVKRPIPTSAPSSHPSSMPSMQPTRQPFRRPTSQPSRRPTTQPTRQPFGRPTGQPSKQPFNRPTSQPSRSPTNQPTRFPTSQPTGIPTNQPLLHPTAQPSAQPTGCPSGQPSKSPTGQPTDQPSKQPTGCPSAQPSSMPTKKPSFQPTSRPTVQPTGIPSNQPSGVPTHQPTSRPSCQPSKVPSSQPSARPSKQPINRPTSQPSRRPTNQPSRQPTSRPSSQPSRRPTSQPSRVPTRQPTGQPSRIPTNQPTRQPSRRPTSQPSRRPTSQPSARPSRQPTGQPSRQPTGKPSGQPSRQPTGQPTSRPSNQPSGWPTTQPTCIPSMQPTSQPTGDPTSQPSTQPSNSPSTQPSAQPTCSPSSQPTDSPSQQPSSRPTGQPSRVPSSQPTWQPSQQPTGRPSTQPSSQPTKDPTSQPSGIPSMQPSAQPSIVPSCQPSSQPSFQPSRRPSSQPSRRPTSQPSALPSRQPSARPSRQPTSRPSAQPSRCPTAQPSRQPSHKPSSQPSRQPTSQPSGVPTRQPTTQPTRQPFGRPTGQPSRQPTGQPTKQPTQKPTGQPSRQPTDQPSGFPSSQPSGLPSVQPTALPSRQPTLQPSSQPTKNPTSQPTALPSCQPSSQPTGSPTDQPSAVPSSQPMGIPTGQPSSQPSFHPTTQPTDNPTRQPSGQPSSMPTGLPSSQPSMLPSNQPTVQPSSEPTGQPSSHPSEQPTSQPTRSPSLQPTVQPTNSPTVQPTGVPSSQPFGVPSGQPSRSPTSQPSRQPTRQPTGQPSRQPSSQPTRQPTRRPTSQPSRQPTRQPTAQASRQPTSQPSSVPTMQPTSQPSRTPSRQPSGQPSRRPTTQPSSSPTSQPSMQPSRMPSTQPSAKPSRQPTFQPSAQPSRLPSSQPSRQPSSIPSHQPTNVPTAQPSRQPYMRPSGQPSRAPSVQPTGQPSRRPTSQPSRRPTTQPSRQPVSHPTGQPSRQPVMRPSGQPSRHPTSQPSRQPSRRPTVQPTQQPTSQPTAQPFSIPTLEPTGQPSGQPSLMPSTQPTHFPSSQPSSKPTLDPSSRPSSMPTCRPSARPTVIPTQRPLCHPTSQPTQQPTSQPSRQPTRQPTGQPSRHPSRQPTRQPTSHPSSVPTDIPTNQPSKSPSMQPTMIPSSQPTEQPSSRPTSLPSTQPTKQPSGSPTSQPSVQPTTIPTSSHPTGQPSIQPTGVPTIQPSVSPTTADLYAYSFNVTQAISGTTRTRYTKDKTKASKAFITTVTDIVPGVIFTDVRIIKVTDVTLNTDRRLEAVTQNEILATTNGILVLYGVSYIPSSKDDYDKLVEYNYINSTLTQSVNTGVFDSVLHDNAVLFNATSLINAEATSQLFTVSAFLLPFFLHSPRPSSQPSSAPTQQPFASPTSLPSAQPAMNPSSLPSSSPSSVPTSVPTFTLATRYTMALEELIQKYTPPQIYLKNVYYEAIARDAQVFDTCTMWNNFLDNNLEYSSFQSSKLIKNVQLLQQAQLDTPPVVKRCTTPEAAANIVNGMASRNNNPTAYPEKLVIACDGDTWVVNNCDSNGVAVCVNCNDPCEDLYCAVNANISAINPNENANFSTGYITMSPCVDDNYDYDLCPVWDGLARVFSVEMEAQSAGVLPVFFAYFTAGLILVISGMVYEQKVYGASKKKVQDVRVFNTPSTRNVELDNLADVYPPLPHSDSRGSGDFHGQNPTQVVHHKYVKTTMLTQLASIFRFTYFDPKINVTTIDDGPQEMTASNRQLREKIWLGVFPFHYVAMAYHSIFGTSRSLRIKYHILAIHRMILVVFFMSVFFNAQFVADDGTCNRQTTKENCESFRTTFSTSVQTCIWNNGVFLVTDNSYNELFVPQCTWQNYQPTSDIYFRLVLVSLLIASLTRHCFHNKAFEQILFHNSKTIYYSNLLLSLLQLGINRHRLLFVRAWIRSALRFGRKSLYRMIHCLDRKPQEEQPMEVVRRNSGGLNDASVVPANSPMNMTESGRVNVDHNTVSESVAIQISSDSTVMLNDFKQSLFSHRALFRSGGSECQNFDQRWGISEEGTLFSLTPGEPGCVHKVARKIYGEHCDPEILLAEEMITVNQEGNQVSQELLAWTANRQAYLEQKKKRKNTIVESYEESVGKGLFLLFVLDLIGRDTYVGMSFQRILYDTIYCQSQPQTTTMMTKFYLLALLIIDALLIFYSVQYTREKPYELHYVWFILAILCLAVDIIVIEGVELLWCKVITPYVINNEVLAAIQVLVGLVNNYNGSVDTSEPSIQKDVPKNTSEKGISKEENSNDDTKKEGAEKPAKEDAVMPASEENVSKKETSLSKKEFSFKEALSRKNSSTSAKFRKKSRAVTNSNVNMGQKFTIAQYFAVAWIVTPKYKTFPQSTVIESYVESLPPTYLADMCHYNYEAVVEAARQAEVEDSTAYILCTSAYRYTRKALRSSAYYFVLWTSSRLPTEIQRILVSTWTIFMIFVIYKLAKQVMQDVQSGLIAIFLIAAFFVCLIAVLSNIMCPINFASLRSGVRVAQDWSANIFKPAEDVDESVVNDGLSNNSVRNERELQSQHNDQVMEDALNDVLGINLLTIENLRAVSSKEPRKPEEYVLSESEYDSNDSDDDDDLSSNANDKREIGDLDTSNHLMVFGEEAKMGESQGEIDTSSSEEDEDSDDQE